MQSRRVEELTKLVPQAQYRGPEGVEIKGPCGIDCQFPDHFTYIVKPEMLEEYTKGEAALCLVPLSVEECDKPILRCPNPRMAAGLLCGQFAPEDHRRGVIHPTAVMEEDASIGRDVTVSAHCYIGARCRIGDGCYLFPGVTLLDDVRLGKNVIINSGAVIGSEGFGFEPFEGKVHKIPQLGGVEIGDDVEIGACVTVDRGTIRDTVIGAGTKIDNLVQVGHNVRIGRNVMIAAQAGLSGSVEIGDSVVVGGQAGFAGHQKIGSGATIAGQAGVFGDIPEGQHTWSGYPAREHGKAMRSTALVHRLPELFAEVKRIRRILEDPEGNS